MADTWQVNIYKINYETKLTKKVFEELEKNNYIESQKSLKILLKTDGTKYNPQQLENKEVENFELHLFYRKSPKAKPDWKDFLSEIITDGENILTEIRNSHESFVLFLYEKTSKNLFVICGGYGFFTIQDYIEDSFGIDVLSRIVDNKNEKIIAHAKELGVTGGILGITKHFRQNFNFHENNNFGNVYREITTYLDKEAIKKVGLDIDSNTNALCLAKTSFRINKSINFDSLIKIVKKCNHIIENEDVKIDVNSIKLIDNKKDKLLVEELNKSLFELLWKLKTDKSLIVDIDLTHKDFNEFLTAYKFIFNSKQLTDKETLLIDIIENVSSLPKKDFFTRLKNAELSSFDESNNPLTKGKFIDHLILELIYESKSYFFINGKWFVITSSFIDELNENCKDFIDSNYNERLDKDWNRVSTPREGDYNLLYKGNDKTVVLDTLTPEGIEPCDILKYDDEKVYLYHVKKGFNGSMRDLCSQVFISANRIHQDIKSGHFSYISEVHARMEASDKYKDQMSSIDEFLNLFRNKKLVFVLAVLDEATIEKDIMEIEKFKSNVAKFSLKELIEKMKSKGFAFEITQIKQG